MSRTTTPAVNIDGWKISWLPIVKHVWVENVKTGTQALLYKEDAKIMFLSSKLEKPEVPNPVEFAMREMHARMG